MLLSISAHRIWCGGAILVLLASSGTTGRSSDYAGQGAPAAPSSPDAQRCGALLGSDFEGLPDAPTRITGARLVDVPPADPQSPAGILAASPIKQYCQVLGYVAPQNKFELRLPLPAQWNQKLHLTPCAGFCGSIGSNFLNPALAKGYASFTGNGGHDSPVGFDGVWAANNPNLQEDFAWRHNHVITVAAKAVATKFYGQPIARSYMAGCSKGGHGALMEAQRFPEDFDGLIVAAPVYDFTGRVMAGAWWAKAVSDDQRGSILNNAVAETVQKSVLGRCGAQAGVDEGLVTDPVACDWRPELIACPADKSDAGCLSPRQVDAIKKMMSPVVNSKGEVIYAYPDIAGTATEWAGWHYGRGNAASPRAYANYILHDQFLRYMADPTVRKDVDPLTFDPDKGPASLERARKLYDATSPDLRTFKARNGKMLMWHGLADASILASSSIGYYQSVEKLMGGRAATQDFFRLFLIPGVHHCGGGPGLSEFDALTLLENWVEKGQSPDVLLASRKVDGVTERTRPIYPYPILARYSGKGDPKQAASFVPFDPGRH